MSKKTKWHKGPPPSVGWWPASAFRNESMLRWWDGATWSWSAHISRNWEEALARSIRKCDKPTNIEWTDRPASWPARSRT